MGILKNEQNYLISDDGSYLIYNESSSQNILFTETFDSGVGTTPPENWDTEVVSGGNTISFVTTNTAPVVSPYEGTKFVLFNSFEVSSGQNRLKRTTSVSSIGYSNVSLS